MTEGAQVALKSEGLGASISAKERMDELTVYYRSAEMDEPQILYSEIPEHPDKRAVYASILPTFAKNDIVEEFKVLEDECPDHCS